MMCLTLRDTQLAYYWTKIPYHTLIHTHCHQSQCHHLMEQHEQRVVVEKKETSQTTHWYELPLKDAQMSWFSWRCDVCGNDTMLWSWQWQQRLWRQSNLLRWSWWRRLASWNQQLLKKCNQQQTFKLSISKRILYWGIAWWGIKVYTWCTTN